MINFWKSSVVGVAVLVTMAIMPINSVQAASSINENYWPLRVLGEETGAVIKWEQEKETAVWTKGDVTVELPVGSNEIKWNGQTIKLGLPVRLINDQTFLPSDFAKEWLGVERKDEGGSQLNNIGLARQFVDELRKGSEGQPLEQGSMALTKLLPSNAAASIWTTAEKQFGDLVPLALVPILTHNEVHQSVALKYTSNKTMVDLTVRFNGDGKVDDFQWTTPNPAEALYKPADYDHPTSYQEQEVVIGQTPWRLPGTLTIPAGEGPFPVVILVHGSGPNDRDGSVLALKPYRDLATGLAAQGIAVLRYEKRTKEHNVKSAWAPQFTVNEETVADAIEAAAWLAGNKKVDKGRIFVAGHSLGGMMIPRILKADSTRILAGAIVLEGPAKPLENVLVDQYTYFAGLGALPKEQVTAMEEQVAILQDAGFDASHPPAAFKLGTPFYWKDLRSTYAPEEARALKGPLLIVQGERDYQVPPEHLAIWRKALAGRTDATFLTYPKMNHMLVDGEGTPNPQEYAMPGHVSLKLIQDIADWVKTLK